jgi:hypothetical protein
VASIALPSSTIEDQIMLTAQAVSSIMLVILKSLCEENTKLILFFIKQVMSFRGFVLFVINLILAIYLFIETFKIYDFNSKTVPMVKF